MFLSKKLTNEERKNARNYLSYYTVLSIFSSLCALPIIQAFLLSYGFSNQHLGLINTTIIIAAVMGALLVMGVMDTFKQEKIILLNSLLCYCHFILPMVLIGLGWFTDRYSLLALMIIITAWSLFNFLNGARNIAEQKISRSLIRSQNYGFIFGLCGLILSVIGVVGGFAAKAILDLLDERYRYELIFFISMIFIPFVIYYTRQFRVLEQSDFNKASTTYQKRNPWEAFIASLQIETLKFATWVHVIRGIFNSVAFFALPIGVQFYNLPLNDAPYVAIIFAISGIAGNYMIFVIYDRIGTVNTTLIATLTAIIAFICLFFTRDSFMYLIFISLFIFAYSVINWSIPLGVYKITPNHLVSAYTGVRVVVMQSSEALFSFLIGLILLQLALQYLLTAMIVLFLVFMWAVFKAFHQEDFVQ